MKLYYAPYACSLACHIALIESGLPFSLERVDLDSKITEHGRDYRLVNPKGLVPALELQSGEILTESVAILLYIAQADPKAPAPKSIEHWRTVEDTAFISNEIHKYFKPLFDTSFGEAAAVRARTIIADRYAYLSKRQFDGNFLTGERASIADFYLLISLVWAKMVEIAIPPEIESLGARIAALRSVQTAIAREGWSLP